MKIKQFFNPYNWFLYTRSKIRKIFLPKDVLNFYNYLTQRSAVCPDCVLNNKCKECGCATPDIFYEGKECNKYKEYKIFKNK